MSEAMDAQAVREIFRDREKVFSDHWLALARRSGQDLYGSRDAQAITEMRTLFVQMAEDVHNGMIDEKTMLGYCHALLPYCDLSNDWRDWPAWAEQVLQHADPTEKVWLLYGLGRYMEEIGELQESLAFHSEGLELCESRPRKSNSVWPHWMGMHWMGMGITLQRNNRLVEAEDYLQRALNNFRAGQDLYQQANVLANLASSRDRHGKLEEAITSYTECVTLLRKIENRFDLCRILYSIGIAYMRANQPYQAQSAFLESQELGSTTGNYYFLALSYYGMAWLQYRLGELEIAKSELEAGLATFDRAIRLDPASSRPSFPEIQGNMYLLAGAIYARGPEFDVAFHYLDRAESSYRQLDHHDELLQKVLANRARVYEHSEAWTDAESLFLELVEGGKRIRSLQTCGDGGVHLIRIYRKRQASIVEWIKLFWRLGLYGLLGMIAGYRERILRRFSLSRKG